MMKHLTIQPDQNMTEIETVVLDAAAEAVYGRDGDYGTPEDNFGAIAKKWNAHIEKKIGQDPGLEPRDVAYMMIDLKTCRAADGDYNADTDTDIAGYAESAARIQADRGDTHP